MEGLDENKGKSVPISKRQVYEGYLKVKSNSGGAGIDEMSLEELEKDLGNHLYKLRNRLSSGSYFPPAVKQVFIPKGGKGYRPLGIPTVLDRIAQTVLKTYCEPRLEVEFSDNTYGYRPGRGAHQALAACRKNCWKIEWVIDMDIKGFFDNIDHKLQDKAIERHFPESWVVMYIERWLQAGVMNMQGEIEKKERGTPQGGVISPLLANLFLHYAFDKWMEINHSTYQFERYADDIIVHCSTQDEAEALLEQIRGRLRECGLELHPEKTKIVYCQKGKRKNKNKVCKKFTYLGYDFKRRKQWNRNKQVSFLSFDLGIGHKAKVKIRRTIKELMSQLHPKGGIEQIATLINAKVQGWTAYYGKFNRHLIRSQWLWINYRMVKWLMRTRKRFKGRIRATVRWLRRRSKITPQLFVHWKLGCTP